MTEARTLQLGLMVGDLVRVRPLYAPAGVGTIVRAATHYVNVDMTSGHRAYIQVWGVDKVGAHELTDEECAALMKWRLTR